MSVAFQVFCVLVCYASFLLDASQASTYDLCDVGEVITSSNGAIIGNPGIDCTRVILAPIGFRIRVIFHKNSYVSGSDLLFCDGGVFRSNYAVRLSQGYTHDQTFTSGSNAIVAHMDKIINSHTSLNISFAMFRQRPDRCKCIPLVHGNAICTLYNQLIPGSGDILERNCKATCQQGYHTRNINLGSLSKHFQYECVMDHGDVGPGEWKKTLHFDQMEDNNEITCSKVRPIFKYELLAYFNYNNVTCIDTDLNVIEWKVREYLVNYTPLSSAGECFKHTVANNNINCSVQSLNVSCTGIDNGTTSRIRLQIHDHIGNWDNYTVGDKISDALFSIFRTNLTNSLKQFIPRQLVIRNRSATDLTVTRPYFFCPASAAYSFYQGSPVCMKCSRHFHDTLFENFNIQRCEICPNGTRREPNEDTCVPGVQDYPLRSFDNCQHTCPMGMFYNANSTLCEWCPYGTYQNSTGEINPLCQKCPEGKTTGFVGARNVSECIHLCPAGHYLQFTTCIKCPIGYFMPNASNRFHKCHECPTIKTTLNVGAVYNCVEKCTTGQYFNITTNSCVLCPNNTYQDTTINTNTRNCKDCPVNTVTANIGSQSSSDCLGNCSAGKFLDVKSKTCSPCPLNTYQNETQHFNFDCKPCEMFKKTINLGSTNINDCIYYCKKGEFFNTTSTKCEKCPINTHQNNIGRANCFACQGNTFTLRPGSENCISPCNYGQFLNKSAEHCEDCSIGHHQNVMNNTAETCMPCPLGFYNDETGEKNCMKCPGEKITVIIAANSLSECINPCQPGTYLNKSKKSCEECLKGFYQNKNQYRFENCTLCPSAKLTTVGSGSKSLEECVGYCASSPCLNGGNCIDIDYGFNCTCLKYIQGKTCNNIIDIENTDIFEVSVRFTSIAWNVNLSNPESDEFIKLSREVENAIRNLMEYIETFRSVTMIKCLRGSVISNFEIVYVTDNNYTTPIDNLKMAVTSGNIGNLTTDNSSLEILNFTCKQPLGMEDGRIPDSAIASSASSFHYPPKNARLNSSPFGWAPTTSDSEYLQVDFGQDVFLTGIATQGSSYNGGSWLEAYYLTYSSDGKNWVQHNPVLAGNNDVSTTVRSDLKEKVSIRYIRVYPYSFEKWISYRIEFYGCPIPKGVPMPTQAPTGPVLSTSFPSTKYKTTSVYDDDDDESNVGLIVGLVVAGIIVILLVIFAVVCLVKKSNNGSTATGMELDEKEN